MLSNNSIFIKILYYKFLVSYNAFRLVLNKKSKYSKKIGKNIRVHPLSEDF